MYNVGDHVVYPMHGAGVIVAIEEREVLGERQKYYIMQLPIGDMKVMIPMNAVDDLGLRQVIGPEEVERVYQVLQGEETAMSSNWNRRYRANMEKIKVEISTRWQRLCATSQSGISRRVCPPESERCWIRPGRSWSAN